MRRIAVGVLLAVAALCCAAALAQVGPGSGSINNPAPTRSGQYGIAAAPQYCQITSLATIKTLITANCATGTILATASIAQICVETAGVRYTSSGVVAPTAAIGMPVAAGACFQYAGPLTTFTVIQQAGGAVLDIETFP